MVIETGASWLEVDHRVAGEVAVEHHRDAAVVGSVAADEPVAHERQAVVAHGLPTHAVAGLEAHVAVRLSATTASANCGQSVSASSRHSWNGRLVRATTPVSIDGSTHIIEPEPPK